MLRQMLRLTLPQTPRQMLRQMLPQTPRQMLLLMLLLTSRLTSPPTLRPISKRFPWKPERYSLL
jgi:hypothetical protein